MTVATRLDIVASGQDRVSAVLRQVNAQLSATAEKLREAKHAADEGPEVEDLFMRAKDRRMAAAAEERRAAVMSTRLEREAAAAKRDSMSLTERAADGLKGASKVQEGFNKVLGVAGFIGVVGGAVVGIGELIVGLASYDDQMKSVRASQERLNELIAELTARGREFQIANLAEPFQGIARATDDLESLSAKYLEHYQLREHNEAVLQALQGEQAKYELQLLQRRAEGSLSASQEHLIQQEIGKILRDKALLEDNIAMSKRAEALAADLLNQKHKDANVSLVLMNSLAGEVGAQFESLAGIAGLVGDGVKSAAGYLEGVPYKIELAAHQAKQAIDEEAKKRREEATRAAAAQASKNRDLARELDLAQTTDALDRARLERQHIEQDIARRLMGTVEGQLRLKLNQLAIDRELARESAAEMAAALKWEYELREAAAQSSKAKADRVQTLREELALLGAQNDLERARLTLQAELRQIKDREDRGETDPEVARLEAKKALVEFEKAQSEERVRSIERTGEAVASTISLMGEYEPRLAGLSTSVGKMTGVFKLLEEGSLTTSEAIIGGIGAFGEAAAAFAKTNKDKAYILGAFHQIQALASLAYLDLGGFARHQAVAVAAFAFAGKSSGGGGGGAAGPSSAQQQPSSSGQGSRGREEDKREIMVAFPNGIVYGTGGEVAKAASEASQHLDGTGMGRRRF